MQFFKISWYRSGEISQREKRTFFIQAPTVLEPRTRANRRLIIRIRICQPPPQALRFSQGRGERLVINCKGPWEGCRRQGKPVFSFPPSFARKFSSGKRRLGTRQQIYAADASGMTRFGLFVIGSLTRHQKFTH